MPLNIVEGRIEEYRADAVRGADFIVEPSGDLFGADSDEAIRKRYYDFLRAASYGGAETIAVPVIASHGSEPGANDLHTAVRSVSEYLSAKMFEPSVTIVVPDRDLFEIDPAIRDGIERRLTGASPDAIAVSDDGVAGIVEKSLLAPEADMAMNFGMSDEEDDETDSFDEHDVPRYDFIGGTNKSAYKRPVATTSRFSFSPDKEAVPELDAEPAQDTGKEPEQEPDGLVRKMEKLSRADLQVRELYKKILREPTLNTMESRRRTETTPRNKHVKPKPRFVDRITSLLAERIAQPDESFSARLRRFVTAKDMDDVDVYKRANLSRQHWSKIISNKDYQPGKRTAVALAIALRLNIDETRDLLLSAGFALSRSYVFDLIIEYFITNGNYDIYEINEVLFKYEQPLLG
jgi:transcriptional regulator with XRE-family HTH domain